MEMIDQISSTSRVSYVPFTNTFRSYKGLSIQEKMMYMCLWSMAGDKGSCYPAIPTLAEELQISESTVKRLLNSLEEKGCIYTVNQKHRTTKKQLNNLYYVIEFNPYESKFNTKHIEVLKCAFPEKVRFLDDDMIKTKRKSCSIKRTTLT